MRGAGCWFLLLVGMEVCMHAIDVMRLATGYLTYVFVFDAVLGFETCLISWDGGARYVYL